MLLLALMIALLPLRGWVGDVMAMEKVSGALSSVHAAESMHQGQHEAQPCHEHAGDAHAAPTGVDDSSHAGGDCASCTVCQICHSVALTSLLPLVTAAALPTVAPHTHAVLHASAERAPGFKPPIS
ncbi:hypothetical protein [Curvibacter sp. PAE-UM]|uniref:hypothetical protein n=1 Tax=Curvibacter sp. PAE-UM TaxID=1714344 RepID=UPI0012E357B6|nr:hypothetical protein [Curvibacter sp. PAE-UM]